MDFVERLTPIERAAMEIARRMLGTSFDLTGCNAYLARTPPTPPPPSTPPPTAS
jgi:hypothetical protein